MRTSVKRYKIGLIAEPEEPPAALGNGACRFPVGVAWKFGEGGCQLRCRPRHLTEVQNYEDVLNRLLLSLDPVLTGMRPTMRKKSKSFLKETLEILLPMEYSEVLDEEDSDHEETYNGINDLSSDE
ncbi:hypothetical protein AVEN_98869-1 [Araneus ventricosus]|uniref:Uncharacterized protein n=1 Tax=Araneus ventricosus TaxID=182803 RepID=A0A4Y2FWX5_ARAVE|nr:hypothetical protein AVEN_98869-1 [Araneus ventricosus]